MLTGYPQVLGLSRFGVDPNASATLQRWAILIHSCGMENKILVALGVFVPHFPGLERCRLRHVPALFQGHAEQFRVTDLSRQPKFPATSLSSFA
jgi:hypothetical protein